MNDKSTGPAPTALDDLLFLATTKKGATPTNLEDRIGLAGMILQELGVHDEVPPGHRPTLLLARVLSDVATRARTQAIAKLEGVERADDKTFDPDKHSSFQAAAAGELLGFGDDKLRDRIRKKYYPYEPEWLKKFNHRDYRGPLGRRRLYAGVWIGGQHPGNVARESKRTELLKAFKTALGDYLSEDERREELRALLIDNPMPQEPEASAHPEQPLSITAPKPPISEPPPTVSRRQWKRIAIAGLSAAVLVALIVVVRSLGYNPTDAISIKNTSIDFTVGQATSPDLVIPKDLSELDRPPVIDGQNRAPFDAWAMKHMAVSANRMGVRFVARSSMIEPTIITGARVKVVRREAPLSGTWIAPDGAGTQPVRQMYANLDTTPPAITKDENWAFPLRISRTDPEIFTVVARTQNCHCYWQIELDVLLPDGEAQTVIVDDNGKPFELTSANNTSSKTFLPNSNEQPWPR